jgi:hypothetical protein
MFPARNTLHAMFIYNMQCSFTVLANFLQDTQDREGWFENRQEFEIHKIGRNGLNQKLSRLPE